MSKLKDTKKMSLMISHYGMKPIMVAVQPYEWGVGRDTFTQKSEFQLGRYELVLQMYPVDQRKKI